MASAAGEAAATGLTSTSVSRNARSSSSSETSPAMSGRSSVWAAGVATVTPGPATAAAGLAGTDAIDGDAAGATAGAADGDTGGTVADAGAGDLAVAKAIASSCSIRSRSEPAGSLP